MSLVVNERFPGKTAGATQKYPYGEARNVSGPGNGDGTPWDAALVNDIFGLLQGLLVRADITPNGQSDTALSSQYLQALFALFMPKISYAKASLADKGFISLPLLIQNYENTTPYQREITIQWGVRDFLTYPGEISDSVVFPKQFTEKCVGFFPSRKMAIHSSGGDGGVKIIEVNKEGFSVSLQSYGGNPTDLRGYFWFAIGF